MNYYNENDPKAAAWLRELIRGGHIPAGDVDERSIIDVKPHELTGYVQQHFFAGIGGWSLALKLAGWPEDKRVRTGSCPCQPFSQTGKRLGTRDERHLWPHFRDLITFGESTVTFGEQVRSPLGREWLAGVRADLEGLGYEVGAADLCAASVGAPHIRQRLYWVAHTGKGQWRRGPNGERNERNGGDERRSETSGYVKPRRETGGLVLANSTGRIAGQPAVAPAGHGSAVESTGGANGLGHAHEPGPQERPESEGRSAMGSEGKTAFETGIVDGKIVACEHQWPRGTPNLVVCCEDGKARRFEPGSFPLAHGVSHRVGLLRGYGNAIVPQVAAEFIQAACESIGMSLPAAEDCR